MLRYERVAARRSRGEAPRLFIFAARFFMRTPFIL